MSAQNGDRARFQRQRKATVVRREKSRDAHEALKLDAASRREAPDAQQSGGSRGHVATASVNEHDAVAE